MVGKRLVSELLSSPTFNQVIVLVRKPINETLLSSLPNPSKLTQRLVDFAHLNVKDFKGAQVGFSCLGTTRADAGSDARFVEIDHDYTLNSAKLMRENNVDQFHLLTAGGSNANSWLLYPRTKGLLEKHVAELGFPRLVIYRPGLLLHSGDQRDSNRTLEKMAIWVATTFGIRAGTIEMGMLAKTIRIQAESNEPGTTILENAQMWE